MTRHDRARRVSPNPPKYVLGVSFHAEPVEIEVEAESLSDAWERRYELAGTAEIAEYEVHPTDVREVELTTTEEDR